MGIVENLYDIMECMGKGLNGELYKVREKHTNRIMAMKVIKRSAQERLNSSFYDKWDLLKELKHDCLGEYIGFYQNANSFFLILE